MKINIKCFIFMLATSVINANLTIDYVNDQFLMNGQPYRYVAGSLHYFRVPQEYWSTRIAQMKSAGLNAVQFYIPWNYHESSKGTYDLESEMHNVTQFLHLIHKHDMMALVRIGPYVCGEWENGGLPYWLLNYTPELKMRSSDERWMSEMSTWLNMLVPTIITPMLMKNGGPIGMVQIENEYGSYDACDIMYTTKMRDLVRQHVGYDTILYTTDGASTGYLKCGFIPDVYPTVDFGNSKPAEVLDRFASQRVFSPRGPLVNSEFYPGWLDLWGQKFARVQTSPTIDTMKSMWSLNASFNIYMMHGGTNYGYWNGAETNSPVITSYDYDAPITEAGDITPKYMAMRAMIKSVVPWTVPPLVTPINSTKAAYGKGPPLYSNMFDKTVDRMHIDFDDVRDGALLEILVENRGRQTYETIVDHKGITKNVTLSGSILTNWTMTAVDLDAIYEFANTVSTKSIHRRINELEENRETAIRPFFHPGIYLGSFTTSKPADTFLSTDGWGKGQFLLNGRNIGRYWPLLGPQVTLYCAKPYIKNGKNELIVLELEKENNSFDFVAEPLLDASIFVQIP